MRKLFANVREVAPYLGLALCSAPCLVFVGAACVAMLRSLA